MKILRLHEVKEFPKFRELTPEELKEAYALAKASFTADDLYHCIEEEEGLPMEDLLKEMEENQKRVEQKNP
jgi:hypothetical protein